MPDSLLANPCPECGFVLDMTPMIGARLSEASEWLTQMCDLHNSHCPGVLTIGTPDA